MHRTHHSQLSLKRGMSLVESLIAISILLVVTTAVMTTAQGSLRATYASRDQITAFYLAQEANEYIRNTRDTNTLSETNEWNTYLTDCFNTTCIVDTSKTPDADGLMVCGGSCNNLRYDTLTHQYGYSSGDESRFKRYVSLEQPGANSHELRVTTTVEWRSGQRDREIIVESLIFNWNN